jgi:hypothetical protein
VLRGPEVRLVLGVDALLRRGVVRAGGVPAAGDRHPCGSGDGRAFEQRRPGEVARDPGFLGERRLGEE